MTRRSSVATEETTVVPDTPFDTAVSAASLGPRGTIKPVNFFQVVPRPVIVKDGKVVKSGKVRSDLGDIGLRGEITPRFMYRSTYSARNVC